MTGYSLRSFRRVSGMVKYDSEQYRKEYWEKEYSGNNDVPSSRGYRPSTSLRNYIERSDRIKSGNALDLGSGNGRNSIFLAQNGFEEVVGIELSSKATDLALAKQKEEGAKGITFINQSLALPIEYPDNHFDLIIDMMTMHAMAKEARDSMFNEIKRLLKPGGQFLFFSMSTEGSAAQRLIKENPGIEPGSYRFEFKDTMVSEKTFTREELVSALSPLKLVEFNQFKHETKAFGGIFERVYISGIFAK